MLDQLIASALSDGDRSQGMIDRALEAVRQHLDMEVAYVSQFVDNRAVFREVDAPGLEAMIKVGDSFSLNDTYCRHILEGRLPELIADTAEHPLAQSILLTHAVPIGSHMSVPIHLEDGSVYGMFCCLSRSPNRTFNQRDLQIMRVFADMTAHQINREVVTKRESEESRALIEQVIDERAFALVYQPIVTFEPYRVVGFEALCRFTHQPYRSPDVWFKQAAAAGCGIRLEMAVLEAARSAFPRLPDHVSISVNASPDTILAGGLPALFAGWPLNRVVLEVTEHAKIDDYGALCAALAPLRRAGVRLAIDDAGAGYSSLQHIIQLSPEIIKLDISLTRSIDSDPARRALAAALNHFAEDIGGAIVAEGIETEGEFETLKALGVERGQGYFIGRPADLNKAEALFADALVAA